MNSEKGWYSTNVHVNGNTHKLNTHTHKLTGFLKAERGCVTGWADHFCHHLSDWITEIYEELLLVEWIRNECFGFEDSKYPHF